MIADVYINEVHTAHHEGGYSAFRVNITDILKEENHIVVSLNNDDNNFCYPQKADFQLRLLQSFYIVAGSSVIIISAVLSVFGIPCVGKIYTLAGAGKSSGSISSRFNKGPVIF